MSWTREFSLLLRDLHGAQPVAFTAQMWDRMLQCQGGHDVKEALDLFQVNSGIAANEVMRQFPAITWELLLAAICESRQAWQYFKDDGEKFCFVVEAVRAHPVSYSRTMHRLTKGHRQAWG